MLLVLLCSALVAALAQPIPYVWPQYGGDAAHSGQSRNYAPTNFIGFYNFDLNFLLSSYCQTCAGVLAWKVKLTGPAMGSALVMDEKGLLYLVTRDATLTAVETTTARGGVVWAKRSTSTTDAVPYFTVPALSRSYYPDPPITGYFLTGSTDGSINTLVLGPSAAGGDFVVQKNMFYGAIRSPPSCVFPPTGEICWYGTDGGRIVAVDPLTNVKSTPVIVNPSPVSIRGSPAIKFTTNPITGSVVSYKVFFGAANQALYAWDALANEISWAMAGNTGWISGPLDAISPMYDPDTDFVFVGCPDGVMRAFYAEPKVPGQAYPNPPTQIAWFNPPSYVPNIVPPGGFSGGINSPAKGRYNDVIACTGAGAVVSFDAATGSVRWNNIPASSRGPASYYPAIVATPVVDANGVILVGDTNGTLWALNGADGNVIWSYPTGGPIVTSVVIDNKGIVYVGSGDSYVYALVSCADGRVWSPDLNSCTYCDPGFYVGPQKTCVPCPIGTFSDFFSNFLYGSCTACAPGSFSSFPGATNCTLCAPGTFTGSAGAVRCEGQCSPGSYGYFAGATGQGTCVMCPTGTFQPAQGQSSCIACAAATYGTYSGGSDSTSSCLKCPAGTGTTATGLAGEFSCTACAPGFYQPDTGQTTCLQCDAGRYSGTVGALSVSFCRQCPSGSWQDAKGAATCQGCPAGEFGTGEGGTSADDACQPCPASTFNPQTSQPSDASCLPCSPGSYSSEGSVVCAFSYNALSCACTTRNLSPHPRSAGTQCPINTYADTTLPAASSAVCVKCPSGTVTLASGASSIAACAPPIVTCPANFQPASGAALVSVNDCIPLTCPAPLTFGPNGCSGCPSGTAGLPSRCASCAPGVACPGLLSKPVIPITSAASSGACFSWASAITATSVASLDGTLSTALAVTPLVPPAPDGLDPSTLIVVVVGCCLALVLLVSFYCAHLSSSPLANSFRSTIRGLDTYEFVHVYWVREGDAVTRRKTSPGGLL